MNHNYMNNIAKNYFDELASLPMRSQVTDRAGGEVSLGDFFAWACAQAHQTNAAGNKLMFIGNGGSAAIASHMATDFSKNGGIRALCFNDGSALTCLGNDLGYEQVFAHPIGMHGRDGDLLIAISSSGNSQNIINGVMAARECGAHVITLSGFRPDNKLRQLGDYNVYVPSGEYGFVEVTHQALCHAFIDLAMGWGADAGAKNPVRLSA